jgi:D-alanyl-D-alanine dipeptidase
MTALLVAAALLAPSPFVALEDVAPGILHDMRYATRHNFVGRRIDGYREPVCILTRRAARGLKRAQAAVRRKGYTLKVYDCYRPQRAVDHFARWAARGPNRTKREFYPHLDKRRLFDLGYIAHRSAHSRGGTVDLTLVRLPPRRQPEWSPMELVPCTAPRRRRFRDNSVDMGTGYDCFDARAHTFDSRIRGRARRNRLLLKRTMEAAGFEYYANEWWHFTLRRERYPSRAFDFPVSRRVLRR